VISNRSTRPFYCLAARVATFPRCASATFAADGHLELFKSTKRYDGDVCRAQHGYPSGDQLPL